MSRIKLSAHAAFTIGIFFKGVDGAAETVVAVLLYFLPPGAVSRTLAMATQHELSEDPRDFIAAHLLRLSERFSAETQLFAAAYLLVHGVVKVAVVWALYRRRLWAYPAAVAVFAAFGAYQMYRYFLSPSFPITPFTVPHLAALLLTRLEYAHP